MRHVFEPGVFTADRTGTGTRSVFGHQILKGSIDELLWFLRGDGNAR